LFARPSNTKQADCVTSWPDSRNERNTASPVATLAKLNGLHKPKFHLTRHVTRRHDGTSYLAHAFWHRKSRDAMCRECQFNTARQARHDTRDSHNTHDTQHKRKCGGDSLAANRWTNVLLQTIGLLFCHVRYAKIITFLLSPEKHNRRVQSEGNLNQ